MFNLISYLAVNKLLTEKAQNIFIYKQNILATWNKLQ